MSNNWSDVLEGKMYCCTQASSHALLVEEWNELLADLKQLSQESSTAEQVRLMTIAPKSWGRKKIERWCPLLRTCRSYFRSHCYCCFMVAFPRYLRDNAVIGFYHDDGISRVTSTSKDLIKSIRERDLSVSRKRPFSMLFENLRTTFLIFSEA